jgi:hypothetical protein
MRWGIVLWEARRLWWARSREDKARLITADALWRGTREAHKQASAAYWAAVEGVTLPGGHALYLSTKAAVVQAKAALADARQVKDKAKAIHAESARIYNIWRGGPGRPPGPPGMFQPPTPSGDQVLFKPDPTCPMYPPPRPDPTL